MEFKRSISRLGFLFCIMGAVIGSGWLLGPFFTAKEAGPAAIISWVIGGCMITTIFISYAELSALLPVAGGPTRYLQFSHGTFASFTIGWITWFATLAVAPIETLAILRYADTYLPWLMYENNGTALLSFKGYFIAAVLLLSITLLNLFGARLLAKTNNWIVVLKLVTPLTLLAVFFSLNFHVENFYSAGFAPMGWEGILSALSTGGVAFSLMGCHAALQYAAEVKDPQRSIPMGIIFGSLICMLLYVLLQAAFIGALNPSDFKQGWNVLYYPGDIGPYVGLASALGAIWLTKLLYVDAIISPYGCALVYTGAAARLSYAMSENGYFPNAFLQLNRFGVPARVLITNYVLGLFLFLPFPTWQAMMSFLVSALILGYAVGPLALNVLRKSMPDKQRPFRVPAAQWIGFIGFYFCNLIVFWTGWPILYKTMLATLIGYLILSGYKWRKRDSHFPLYFANGWWLIPYLAGLSLISYLSSFGGIKVLAFGWDFLAIAVLSFIIYCYSQHVGLNEGELQKVFAE